VQALRSHLRRRLPDHMVPSAFVTLDRMPTTPNGKLDRAALPPPRLPASSDAELVAPRPGSEESLAALWRELLKVDRVGANDNFFLLGGHSMLAAQLRARIHQSLGVELPLGAIFEDQTLAALAVRLDCARDGSSVARPELVKAPAGTVAPASIAQETAWAAEQAAPGSPAHCIDVTVRIRGPLDEERQVRSIHEAFRRHAILRTVIEPRDGGLVQRPVDDLPEVVRIGPVDPAGPAPGADGHPAIRVSLEQTGPEEHLLRLRCHRILGDGTAVRLLLGEIGALYANSLEGMELFPLLDLSLSHADYAVWERQWLTPRVRNELVDEVRRQFDAGVAPPLPTDWPRAPGGAATDGDVIRFELPRVAVDAANIWATGERATLPMVLTAALASALASERAWSPSHCPSRVVTMRPRARCSGPS
jgi:hypothetical protein